MFQFLLCCVFISSPLHAAPLAKRMIDLTYAFDHATIHHPVTKGFKMHVIMNGTGANGIWTQYENYSSDIHVGTHMDAPAHYKMGGATVDQIPFSHLIAPAAVVDVTEKCLHNPDYGVTVEDLLHWESVTGHTLNEVILLLRTGWGNFHNNETAYFGNADRDPERIHSPGLGSEAAQWLVDNRNVYGVGIDAVSFDVGKLKNTPSHVIILGHGMFALENVPKLDALPIYGATLYVMPMKVGQGSGAPTRIVATFPEVIFEPPHDH